MSKGTIKSNGVHLKSHEYATVRILLEHGYDVELIPPSGTEKQPSPDIVCQGVVWEIKSPTGDGKNNIRHNFQNAKRQAVNIIVDLRRSRMQEERALRELMHHYELSKRVRRMKIIKKDGFLLELSK